MRRPWLWAALIVVGAALFWLIYRARKGAASTAIGASGSGSGKIQPSPLVSPSSLPPPTETHDVAYDVVNGDVLTRDFLTDDVNFANQAAMWTDMMRPAGRVRPFADLTAHNWQLFYSWLAMTLTRQDMRSRRWQLFNSNQYSQEVGQQVDSIVGGIVSAIAGAVGGPVVAILLKYAIQTQVQDLAVAIAEETATEQLVDKLREDANPAKLPPSAIIILTGWSGTDDPGMQLARALNFPDDVAGAVGLVAPTSVSTSGGVVRNLSNAPAQPWHTPDGTAYYFPASAFFLTNLGLLNPWVSSELIGADYNATVNLRARLLRCFDIFQAMLHPRAPGSFVGLYWYRNKVYGDLCGCWLPPTDEDSHYVDANGLVYDYNGKLISNAAVAAAGHTEINVTPLPAWATNSDGHGSITPDPNSPQASAVGDGCEFCGVPQPTPPPPSGLSSVPITIPPPVPPPTVQHTITIPLPKPPTRTGPKGIAIDVG